MLNYNNYGLGIPNQVGGSLIEGQGCVEHPRKVWVDTISFLVEVQVLRLKPVVVHLLEGIAGILRQDGVCRDKEGSLGQDVPEVLEERLGSWS